MNRTTAARHWLARQGVNRSTLLRRLIRLGHPRLRELRTQALEGTRPLDRAMGAGVRWLENGVLRIPVGYAAGLGLDMHHLPISHAHFGSLAFGNLETSVQEAMLRHLGAGDVFYDIGANLGFFAMLGSRLVGDEGRVFAFEAAPDNAQAIEANLELNEITNVEVIAKAVASHSGTGRLQVVDDQSWSKLEDYGEHPYTEQVIEVELVAIDELVKDGRLPPPALVKIDVEGAEIAVLEGMRRTIDSHHPAIICELHGTHEEFVEFMTACGYRLINLEGKIPVAEEGASAHALALPALDPGD